MVMDVVIVDGRKEGRERIKLQEKEKKKQHKRKIKKLTN